MKIADFICFRAPRSTHTGNVACINMIHSVSWMRSCFRSIQAEDGRASLVACCQYVYVGSKPQRHCNSPHRSERHVRRDPPFQLLLHNLVGLDRRQWTEWRRSGRGGRGDGSSDELLAEWEECDVLFDAICERGGMSGNVQVSVVPRSSQTTVGSTTVKG